VNATCCRSKAHAECNGTNGVVSKLITMPGSGSSATRDNDATPLN